MVEDAVSEDEFAPGLWLWLSPPPSSSGGWAGPLLASSPLVRKSGSITGSVMKELLSLAYQKEIDLKDYIREHGLMTVRDDDALNAWVEEVILEQAGPVQEYLSGKDKALTFLLGQVMRKARGRADADIVRKALIQKLRKT